jgi:hypothetical protein
MEARAKPHAHHANRQPLGGQQTMWIQEQAKRANAPLGIKGDRPMGWQSYAEKEKEVQETRAKLQRHLEPFNRDAPTPFIEENGKQYEDRVIPTLQRFAPGYEEVKVDSLYGANRELVVNQIYNAAAAEARHPTQIPEGTLRQVTRYDQAGRPFYEFFGSPSAWMSDFTMPKKQLVSIIDNRSFQKV